MNSVLQLSFDIGHSSIGWAVLETRIDKDPTLLGCGSVIFPADDCLASTRRGFRQMRRHARATRQRITRMEDAIAALGSIPRAVLKKQHAQGKGNKRGGGDGSSYPWLFAARVLAAKGDEREKHLLSWPQLWDVLRWYAHNRGYDAHLRFSSEGKAHGFADESASAASDFDSAVEDAEQAEAIEEDGESDSEKLKAGKTLSEEYGFTSNTFAETVAKILLGPPRSITLGKQGKTGKFAQSQQSFSQDDFHRILFETDDPFSEHPRHPLNYFKGIRAAFPRRVLRDGLLVGGTEWEVRRIIRAHFGHLPGCDEKLETLICGSMPEGPKDWLALRETLPRLYLSDEDRSALKELRIRRDATARTRVALKRQRREITDGKLIIPARYEGGLLFGQLGMRFHNRIISTCRFSFARIVDAIQRGDDGALAPFNVTCAGLQKIRRQRKDESDLDYARRWATSLAKVPAKKSREFLLFRWSKRLTELKVKRPALPSLTKDERMQLDEMMREHGWLTKQELKDAIRKVTDYAPSNLDQTFDATPEAAESLVVDPALKYLRTHPFASRIAALLSDKARARLRHELADGKAVALRKIERELSESDRVHFHELLSQYVTEQNAAKKKGKDSSNIEDDAGLTAKKKTKKQLTFQGLRRTSLKASVPSGRAPFHRVILKQAREEILCGENPAKPMLDDSHPSGEDKVAHGCIFETPAITRWLIDGAKTEQNTKDDFARWKERWLSHHTNKVRYDRAEAERTERGEALIRAEWQTAETQRWLAAQTNNHLVAHRMLILENLTRDLIADPLYGNGDASRITGISIEVVRDILTFSGMTRKQLTGRVLPSLRRHHEHVAAFLRESLAGTEYEHRITGDLIRKAKIADDLGWRCPYTGNPYCPYRLANGTMDEDHIIPKSRRLTNAMEALVITYKTINLRKGNQTAWQFVHDNAGKQFEGVEAPIRPIKEYEAWVENRDNKINKLQLAGETAHSGRQSWPKHLPGSGTNRKLHPDYRRRKQRKHYLLIEEFDRDKSTFTPRDLTLTSHLCKLAQQILLRILPKLPEHHITSPPRRGSRAFASREHPAVLW